MSWVTVIWTTLASAAFTLGVVHLVVWVKRPAAPAHLWFFLACVGTAVFGIFEVWLMRATTPAEFGLVLRLTHLPIWLLIVSLVAFVRSYLQAGRPWLGWSVVGVRTLALVLNFLLTPNLNYRSIDAIRPVRFLGESVSVAVGVPSPWMLIGQAGLLLLVIFVVDATVEVWRRGDRRKALVVGGSIVLLTVGGSVQAALVLWGVLAAPIAATLFYAGLVAAMGYELSLDVIRAARLADALHVEQERIRLAEREAQLHREEAAHLARVTTFGEISGSLAHELNQPLASILTNARAAERHLEHSTPDLDELRAILADIRSDNLRASDIIQRIRAFLKRTAMEKQPLDVAQLVEDTVRLIGAEAADRRSQVSAEVSPGLRPVVGDRVHLQQVLVNLLINGLDAMSSSPPSRRRLAIRALALDATSIEITVSDSGPGIAPAVLARAFEPFYTTKEDGLGLGLAISRSIAEAHGGTIVLEPHSDGGTIARVRLPIHV
jgi:two-component system, LuxR family, sensor kinase FixL